LFKICFAVSLLFVLSATLHAQCFDMSMNSTDYPDKTCFDIEVTFENNLALAGGIKISDNTGKKTVGISSPHNVTWCYDKSLNRKLVMIQCESKEREITLPKGNTVEIGCERTAICTVVIGG